MEQSKVVGRVRTILDYNKTSSELDGLDVVGGLPLDDIIKDNINAALQQLGLVVPVELTQVQTYRQAQSSEGRPMSFVMPSAIVVPSDYLRFVSCQADEWDYPVTKLTEAGSKEHLKQFGEFVGLKATEHNPMAVMLVKDGVMSIEVFGGSETRGMTLHYIPTLSLEDLDARLEEPLCYIVASLVCEVLKDTTKSQMLMQTAQSLMVSVDELTTEN